MADIPAKVGKQGLGTLAVAGLTKYFEERFLANTPVGNGTMMSGLVKTGIGVGTTAMTSNKWANAVALGFGIDGIEDILMNVMSGVGFGESISGTEETAIM